MLSVRSTKVRAVLSVAALVTASAGVAAGVAVAMTSSAPPGDADYAYAACLSSTGQLYAVTPASRASTPTCNRVSRKSEALDPVVYFGNVRSDAAYADPSWITSLAAGKVVGKVPAAADADTLGGHAADEFALSGALSSLADAEALSGLPCRRGQYDEGTLSLAYTDLDAVSLTCRGPASVIHEIRTGQVATGSTVTLKGVITAISLDRTMLWLQDPRLTQYGALVARTATALPSDVTAGNVALVTGRYAEVAADGSEQPGRGGAQTTVLGATVNVVDRADHMPAVDLLSSGYLGANLEAYEGHLVRVGEATGLVPQADGSSVALWGNLGLKIGVDVYAPMLWYEGSNQFAGVLLSGDYRNATSGFLTIEPRSAADVVRGYP